MQRGVCVFCGVHGDLSEEDLIPQWANEVLRELAGGNEVVYSTRKIDAEQKQTLSSISRRRQTYSAVKVVRVCKECNNGWMSAIDNEASKIIKPMIRGHRVGFSSHDLNALAMWLVVKALVADLIDHGFPTAGDDEFHWFYDHRQVPDGFIARAGYFDHSKRDVCFFNLEPVRAGETRGGLQAGDPLAFQFMISFGPAWFQALILRRASRDYPRPVNGPPNPYWTRLWPSTTNVNWPPPLKFKREDLPSSLGDWPEVDEWIVRHIGDA